MFRILNEWFSIFNHVDNHIIFQWLNIRCPKFGNLQISIKITKIGHFLEHFFNFQVPPLTRPKIKVHNFSMIGDIPETLKITKVSLKICIFPNYVDFADLRLPSNWKWNSENVKPNKKNLTIFLKCVSHFCYLLWTFLK